MGLMHHFQNLILVQNKYNLPCNMATQVMEGQEILWCTVFVRGIWNSLIQSIYHLHVQTMVRNFTIICSCIKWFSTCGTEKCNICQFLHLIWNLTQQYKWAEFYMEWNFCTGVVISARMPQPVLTQWEYMSAAINWVIIKFEDI